ncbi:hypothetical protein [Neorickettsia sp. 179522]|uniref:hypothetical protein n=1 Tax=Neorickettsia sp. 179522 TaxID=1714371 RepID=UPI00079AF5CF|nr:hypothetical protein [Neorickettsia sp. 179522]KYH12516.1 hypothetical protein AS219_01750 [Neorickettsia sp. 179522]
MQKMNKLEMQDTQQGEQPQGQESTQSNAATQQDAPDSQQGEQPQGTRKKMFQRWSQTLTASGSALKKKAKASIKKASQKLDLILPGENTEQLRLRLLKAEEASTLKEEIQPGMELAEMYEAEVADVFGLQNVNVTPPSDGENGLTVRACYLDGAKAFVNRINDAGKPKPENMPIHSITFGTARALHEWIAAGRAPHAWITTILARAIMNVTGTTPSVIPVTSIPIEKGAVASCSVETSGIVQGAAASSVGQISVPTHPTYKIEGLTQSQVDTLRAFCASLTSPTEPRLRVPYQKVEVEGNGGETFLVLRNFPSGQSACYPFIQEVCALSLECTVPFKKANDLLAKIIEQTTHSPLAAAPPQFTVLFDPVSRKCYLQFPTNLLGHTWTRSLAHHLCSNLKATACLVGTLSPESKCCARNRQDTQELSYHEICKSATEGRGNMAICMPNPRHLFPHLVEVLQAALNAYQCSDKFCRLVPGAAIQTHLGSFCSANIGNDNTGIISLATMVLNAETAGVLPAQPIFTRVDHVTEGQSSCTISSEKLVKLTEEGLRSVARAATRFQEIQQNIIAVTEAILATLPVQERDGNPFSILTASQTTILMKDVNKRVAAVKLSWGKAFLEGTLRPKLLKPVRVNNIHCSDSSIVLPLALFTESIDIVIITAAEIRCELEVTVEEKVPEPDPSQSVSSKPDAKKDAPDDKTAVVKVEPGAVQKLLKNVGSVFARSKSKSPTAPKKTEQPLSTRLRNMFIAVAASVVLAAIIYLLLPLIPRFESMPIALQAVGSIITGALISCIAYTCVTSIQSNSR